MKIRIRRELRDWLIIGLTLGTLYITGLHTEVAAFSQRVILATGFMTPKLNIPDRDKEQAAYDFTLVTTSGDKFKFETLRGKVVFINFWATWCAPCIAEMPNIQSLYEDYQNHADVEFVMISLDRDPNKAKSFIKKKAFTFPVYSPDYASGIPKVYESSVIPTTFVLNKDGYIDTKKVGMANYDTDKFRNYLDRLAR